MTFSQLSSKNLVRILKQLKNIAESKNFFGDRIMYEDLNYLVQTEFGTEITSFLEFSFLSEVYYQNSHHLDEGQLTEENLIRPKKMLVNFTYERIQWQDIDQYRTIPAKMYNDEMEFAEDLLWNDNFVDGIDPQTGHITYEDITSEQYISDDYTINSVKNI